MLSAFVILKILEHFIVMSAAENSIIVDKLQMGKPEAMLSVSWSSSAGSHALLHSAETTERGVKDERGRG
jgi:hypothetical protein